MSYNPYATTYKAQNVLTYTPGEMLTALYDGAILNLNKAMIAIDAKDIMGANNTLIKAQKIVRYLNATLDMNYPISKDLRKLYTYFDERISEANMRKEKAHIEEILPMIAELKESFTQADKLSRSGL